MMDKPIKNLTDDVNLVEALHTIIDSKIQYADFKMNTSISNYSKLEKTKPTANQTQSEIIMSLESINSSKEKLMRCIEHHTHYINLLLIIRKYLEEHNANSVLDLLNEDKFLIYDKMTLERQLKKEQTQEAPSLNEEAEANVREGNPSNDDHHLPSA